MDAPLEPHPSFLMEEGASPELSILAEAQFDFDEEESPLTGLSEPAKKRLSYPRSGYDEQVPMLLKREQQWFGTIISRPIDEDSRMNPISPTGQPMEEEAALHIAPSPTLRPAQRIQLYNQQYWWRLLNTMHESFPLVTRLFGFFDFNRMIGIPYLTKYPPRHWSLSTLGDRFSQWCQEEYHAPDKQLVCQAAELDWAFAYSFTAHSNPRLQLEAAADLSSQPNETLLAQTLYLQPFIFLFEFDYDLFAFRIEFLKQEPDHWLHHEFPALDSSRPYHYILYRNIENNISWKGLSKCEYLILRLFHKGTTIEHVCSWLEDQSSEIIDEAAKNLQLWFQEWTQRGWLSSQK